MPRRHRNDDDSGDFDRSRKEAGITSWLMLAGLVAVVMLAIGGGLFAVWWNFQGPKGGGGTATVKKQLPTREELRTKLMGKTKEEVKAMLGKPNDTKEKNAGNYWIYENIARDPVSEQVDFLTWVRFDDKDRVREVDY